MLTPNGQCALRIEKVMLLSLWANEIEAEYAKKYPLVRFIHAGIGKPTYPIHPATVASYLNYWQNINKNAQEWHRNPEGINGSSAVGYGDPRGDTEPTRIMAQCMSSWYDSLVKPENILFTVGGIGGLRVIFETLNTHYDDLSAYRIITPFPHYSAYSNNPKHCLHPIDVMHEEGYQLTGLALEKSIIAAYNLAEDDHIWPKAILICNPSNPLGTVIADEELIKIAEVLRKYPELLLIFDEAYTEMCFVSHSSFLSIAPDLKPRVIIMRSATKALSAAGERMAILIVFDDKLMSEMLNKNISYFVHAPRSAQIAYAETMAAFDHDEQKHLINYYKNKVIYVNKRLANMGAQMPDPWYQIQATFYCLGDFSDLFGLEMPADITRVFQSQGQITTGEEMAYYLLFNDALMITPLSYFGLGEDCGYLRITCSGDDQELQEFMDRLEHRLFYARRLKKQTLIAQIETKLPQLQAQDIYLYDKICQKMHLLNIDTETCLVLKEQNRLLNNILSAVVDVVNLNL